MSVPLVTNSYDVGPYWQDHSASRSIDGVEVREHCETSTEGKQTQMKMAAATLQRGRS